MQIRQKSNAFTHLPGIFIFFIGMFFLIEKAATLNSIVSTISVIIFSFGLIMLYLASTIYHSVCASEQVIATLRKIDHIMIYILIASSYTPICLISIKGFVGYALLGVIWGLTIVGIFLKIFWTSAPRVLYTSFYLGLGWGAVFAIYPLSKVMSWFGIFVLFLGGISYSVGAIIYAKKPKAIYLKYFGFHEIFHLFILLGSLLHYFFVYFYVLV